MPGDPEECRAHAAECKRLAIRATPLTLRRNFIVLAATWTNLAAELECDKAVTVLSKLEFGEPFDALPRASDIAAERRSPAYRRPSPL